MPPFPHTLYSLYPIPMLSVVQLNCNRQSAVSVELQNYMCANNVQIAILQDQHVQQGSGQPTGFHGAMRVFHLERGGRINRAAIAIADPHIEAVCVDSLRREFGICVWTKGDVGEILICSIYCKPNFDIEPYMTYLEEVVRFAGTTPLLLGVDSNARSVLWHSKVRLNARGQPQYGRRGFVVEETIVNCNLTVLNEPSQWFTFVGGAGQSDIDVSLANQALTDKFTSHWSVDPTICTSDHNAIVIKLRTDHDPEPLPSLGTRWQTRNADWMRFRDDVRRMPITDQHDLSADELQLALDSQLTDVCDVCLTKERALRPGRPRWWSTELEKLRRAKNRARTALQRARRGIIGIAAAPDLVVARVEAKNARRTYAQAMQRVKGADWRRFVSSETSTDPWGAVYRICRRKRAATSIGCFRTPTGMTSNWTESAEVLLAKFIPPEDPTNRVAETVGREPPPITQDEIAASMARFRSKRAPGLDGKRALIYSNVIKAIPEIVCALFNKCLTEGTFPKEWKKGSIVCFMKSPDKDPAEPASYRPITLLPILGKVLERVLVNRLQELIIPHPMQFGFTAQRSTVDAWMMAKEIVEATPTKYVVGVFVDFEGAFDHLNWGPILQKLQQVGCAEEYVWRSYFSDRRSCMQGRRDIVWKDVTRGCPQGSISGPTMWNLVMNDLLISLTDHGIRHVAYADDLLLLVGARSRLTLEQEITRALTIATDWGARVGVRVSNVKTEAMMLKGSFHIERPPLVVFNGSRLKFGTSVRYLGIHVSEGMRFEVHLRETRRKLVTVVAPLRRVLRKEWGLRRKASNSWLKGLLMPVALYGTPVWYRLSTNDRGRKAVYSLQRVALMACLRVCRTVSTDAMQVIAGNTPWDLEAARLTARYKIRRGLATDEHDVLTAAEAAADDRYTILDENVRRIWQNRWEHAINGRITYQFIREVDMNRGELFDPPMRSLFIVTGHGSLNAFLKRRTNFHTAECLCGHPSEDWQHVFLHCVAYDDIRSLPRMGVSITNGVLDVSEVLGTPETYHAFVHFANQLFSRRSALLSAT